MWHASPQAKAAKHSPHMKWDSIKGTVDKSGKGAGLICVVTKYGEKYITFLDILSGSPK